MVDRIFLLKKKFFWEKNWSFGIFSSIMTWETIGWTRKCQIRILNVYSGLVFFPETFERKNLGVYWAKRRYISFNFLFLFLMLLVLFFNWNRWKILYKFFQGHFSGNLLITSGKIYIGQASQRSGAEKCFRNNLFEYMYPHLVHPDLSY